MKAAVEAAQAEIESARHNQPVASKTRSKGGSRSKKGAGQSSNKPVKVSKKNPTATAASAKPAQGELDGKNLGSQSARAPHDVSLDLDPAVVQKLKTLRRLTPNKSDEDLLKQIEMEKSNTTRTGKKRGWFSRT